MTFLPDTNACIHVLRRKGNPHVVRRFKLHPPAAIALCSVVIGELCYGAERSANPPAEQARVDAFLAPFPRLPFDEPAAREYALIRAILAGQGLPIGQYDVMIAAIARANGLKLVTHNTREFSRVHGLDIVDWEIP